MKLLVFAHTPPPHHGQSYMVQLMLSGFGGDRRKEAGHANATAPPESPESLQQGIECYHVNTRLSRHLEDIGDLRIGKMFLAIGYCLQAIWCRYRYGVTNFYYIPAPGKRSALYRDWLVMTLCRPFFTRLILHWHAAGLAKWLETCVQIKSRSMTYNSLKAADLSIVLSDYGRPDAEKLFPRQVSVVPNGIPDPVPDFATRVLPQRIARWNSRKKVLSQTGEPSERQTLRVLFMGHCTRDKGLFDAVEGARLARELLRRKASPIDLKLTVAGQFVHAGEEAEFKRTCSAPESAFIEYVGFVSGDRKNRLLEQADIFCFPSHLESFGLVLVEAMAFGLPIVTTRCGAIPEVLPDGYPGLVAKSNCQEIAEALLNQMNDAGFEASRKWFESRFTMVQHLKHLRAALQTLDQNSGTPPENGAANNAMR